MVEGVVRKVALDFDVLSIAKSAKASKEAKIAEVGADIELVAKQSWSNASPSNPPYLVNKVFFALMLNFKDCNL